MRLIEVTKMEDIGFGMEGGDFTRDGVPLFGILDSLIGFFRGVGALQTAAEIAAGAYKFGVTMNNGFPNYQGPTPNMSGADNSYGGSPGDGVVPGDAFAGA